MKIWYLEITEELAFYDKKLRPPNFFWRFMQWLLLGFNWVEKDAP